MDPSKLTDMQRDCLASRIRLLSRTVTRTYDDALRPHGITIAQANILSTVEMLAPVAAGQVARVLSMEVSTLSRNARLLEQQGWLAIERAERGNGRVLKVTRKGERKLREVEPAWREAQRETKALLGEDGARELQRVADGFVLEQLPH